MPKSCIRVGIVVFPQCDPSIVYGVFDVLWFAGRFWNALFGAGEGEAIFEPRLVSAEPGPLKLITGIEIVPQETIETIRAVDIVFVPNVVVMSEVEIAGLDRRLLDWICRMHAGGAPVYASCGGAIVLAEAGLLEGGEATTHWVYAPLFRRRYPNVTLHENRILVQSGEGRDLVCSGGASSWQDQCLMLVARHAGTSEALRISKLFLFQWHRDGQLPYAAMMRNVDHSDAIVGRCQEWVAENYARRDIVPAMLALSRLPKRTLDRRFKAATGYSPLAYVQALRIEEAKQLLETTSDQVDAVGRQVGYEDAASFRRLFRRLSGMAPADYRRKFQTPRWAVPTPRSPRPGRTARTA